MLSRFVQMVVRATILLLSTGCFRDTYTTLYRGLHTPDSDTWFTVKKAVSGCCGCRGIIINVLKNVPEAHRSLLQSQFLIESFCGMPPTKHIFKYDANLELVETEQLIGVTDSSFTIPVTEIDRLALQKADSFMAVDKNEGFKLRSIKITGYRKPTDKEYPGLMFPVYKKKSIW
jgi:hypothetical protein